MKVLVWYDVPRQQVEIDMPEEEYRLLEKEPEINQSYLRRELYKRESLPIPDDDEEFLDDVTINKIVAKGGKNSKCLYEDWYH